MGGTAAGARNVFAGPIFVAGTGNQIQGNFVGLDVTGTIVIGQTSAGITVNANSSNHTIGGAAANAGNRIGGAIDAGISIDGDSNVVQGNQVGTDATGTVRLANGYWGIRVGGSNNMIGGVGPGEGNIIAYNRGFAGVAVHGTNATVRGNSIFDNAGIQANSGLAIDLTGATSPTWASTSTMPATRMAARTAIRTIRRRRLPGQPLRRLDRAARSRGDHRRMRGRQLLPAPGCPAASDGCVSLQYFPIPVETDRR